MIPYGKWAPDSEQVNGNLMLEAVNCLPAPQGFKPLPAPVAVSEPLPSECRGAVTVLKSDGSGQSYAGTFDKLFRLGSQQKWVDVSRTGDPYATGAGERWRFADFGDNVLATNFVDEVQTAKIETGAAFSDLKGNPPKARYIGVLRDFVVLACLEGETASVQWSGINDSENWTPGTKFSGKQQLPEGGPIQGFLGGEVGWVFQTANVTRMTWVPGSEFIMQFDEQKAGRGLFAPNSLVRVGQTAYYMSADGFYRMDLASGVAEALGVGKWRNWILDDIKAGTTLFLYGSASPRNTAIVWSYVSKGSTETTRPNRALIYDWTLDEATVADVSVQALSAWLTQGVTLDTMNDFGTLDELPVSLDSPFWKGGAALLGIIDENGRLAHLEGPNLPAQLTTADGQRQGRRTLVRAIEPEIDTSELTIEVAARERKADTVSYGPANGMETTGEVPAWSEGNLLRARLRSARGADWSYLTGLETVFEDAGVR